jgi:hypothetical protein
MVPSPPAPLPQPMPQPGVRSVPTSEDRIPKVIDGLLTRKEARPRKLKTLTTFVKAQLHSQGTPTAVSQVIDGLKKAGMSVGDDGKLGWPSK